MASVSPTRPGIIVNGRQLRDVIDDAWRALLAPDRGNGLYNRRGHLVRLTTRGDEVELEAHTLDTLHGLLLRSANWLRQSEDGTHHARPTKDIARDMIANVSPAVPTLEMIATVPVFTRQGALLRDAGYSPSDGGIVVVPDSLGSLAPVPSAPSRQEVTAARSLVVDELLGDFPFVGEADRAHAVAAQLHAHVRALMQGPTPGHLLEAPSPGSGKGLLADCTSIITTGRPCSTCSLPRDEDEIRRTLTAELMRGRPIILLDNLDSSGRSMLHSSTLAAMLTTPLWSDRIVGSSRKVDLPNRALWLLTGNNPSLSMELARRCVRLRLDPQVDRPWQRDGFRHPNLRQWVLERRADLVHARLVLVEAWIAEGRPLYTEKTLGSFESWAAVIGGILQVAGITGFLGNLDQLYEEADAEGREWRALTAAWWREHRSTPVSASALNAICVGDGYLGSVRGGGNEKSQATRLGIVLQGARDRVFGRYRVVVARNSPKGRLYSLAQVEGDVGEGVRDVRDVRTEGPPTRPHSDSLMISATSEPAEDVRGPLAGGPPRNLSEVVGAGTPEKVLQVPQRPETPSPDGACTGDLGPPEVHRWASKVPLERRHGCTSAPRPNWTRSPEGLGAASPTATQAHRPAEPKPE